MTDETVSDVSPEQAAFDILSKGMEPQKTEEVTSTFEEQKAPEAEEKPKSEEEPKKEDLFSKKFAALSRKEKILREKEAKFAATEKRLAELEAKLNAPAGEKKEENKLPFEARLRKDPLGTLKELGYDFNKLTDLALSDGKLSAEDKLELYREELDTKYKSELEKLRAEIAEKEKVNMQKQQEQVIENFKQEISSFVDSSEEHELIRANDMSHEVFNVIELHHQETGKVLSIKEAADLVESHLEEKAKELQKLKKFSKLFGGQQKASDKPKADVINKPTLTNSATTLSGKDDGVEDWDALVNKAAAMLKFE